MSFEPIFERFSQKRPAAVIVRMLIERIFSPQQLDAWFKRTAKQQYTRELLFSSLFELMSQVVQGTHPSINAAYQALEDSPAASIQAVYDKLKGIEPDLCAELVRYAACQAALLLQQLGAKDLLSLPGYRIKLLDGNCIAATEHRIKELRNVAAGALPGKSLVVFDPQLGICIDLFPCEDGHAQERSLLGPVLQSMQPNDLWIADRNFCTKDFLAGICNAQAFFIIREHGQLCFSSMSESVYVGRANNGRLYSQNIEITTKDGVQYAMRRITLKLDELSRDGDAVIFMLTNLPKKIRAAKIAKLYQKRWCIETAFQQLTCHINCEINTLGYPKAALFAFSIACIIHVVMVLTKTAMRVAHGDEEIDQKVSGYYIAIELRNTWSSLDIAISQEFWHTFRDMPCEQFANALLEVAAFMQLRRYRKHTRGPKKPTPKRKYDPRHPHVSTFKILAQRDACQGHP